MFTGSSPYLCNFLKTNFLWHFVVINRNSNVGYSDIYRFLLFLHKLRKRQVSSESLWKSFYLNRKCQLHLTKEHDVNVELHAE